MIAEWRATTIGDEIELAYGKALPAHIRQAGNVPVFGSNGIVGRHISALVEGPGIIVGRKGSVGEISFSSEAFWPIDTTYFVVNKCSHNLRFLFYLLKSTALDTLNSHSAVPGLNRENVYAIEVSLPPQMEQGHIASALDFVGRSIDSETKAITDTIALKRAAMRELFTRGLRGEAQKESEVGLIPKNWKTEHIQTLGTVKGGKRLPKGIPLAEENTGRPYIRVTDFDSHGVRLKNIRFVPRSVEHVIRRYTIRSSDIYISIAGTIGLVGQVPLGLDGANLTENAAKIVVERLDIVGRFIMYALANDSSQSQIVQFTSKNAQPKLALTRIEQIKIALPPTIDEQREIVAILDAIDRKIDLHKRKKVVLEELFKALLHKLMTGEIRVADLDLSALKGAPGETQATA